MGQEEIVKWLTKERMKTDKYFTVNEIKEGCDEESNCHRKVKQLYAYGFVDRKFTKSVKWGGLRPVYRLKSSKVLPSFLEK